MSLARIGGLVLAAALCLPAARPAAAEAPDVAPIVTPGGAAVLTAPMPGADYVQLVLFWPGTAALGPEGREGVFQLGPRLAFENVGGRAFPELREAMEDAGVAIGLVATFAGTTLFVQTDAESAGLAEAAELGHALLTEAALDPDDLARLKRDFADTLAEGERDPSGQLLRALGAVLAPGDRRVAALTNRPFETVERVGAGDVRAWMDATFHSEPIVAAAGPLEADGIAAAVDAILAGLPEPAGGAMKPDPFVFEGEGLTMAIRAPEADVALVAAAFPAPSAPPHEEKRPLSSGRAGRAGAFPSGGENDRP